MLNLKDFEEKKQETLISVLEYLIKNGEDAGQIKDGSFNFPIVGKDGKEGWLVVNFVIPKGSRDGDEYDGYADRDAYKITLKKRKEKAEEKAKKIAKDAEKRAAKEKGEGE